MNSYCKELTELSEDRGVSNLSDRFDSTPAGTRPVLLRPIMELNLAEIPKNSGTAAEYHDISADLIEKTRIENTAFQQIHPFSRNAGGFPEHCDEVRKVKSFDLFECSGAKY